MTENNGQKQEAVIFKDDGSMRVDYSLAYFEKIQKDINGEINKLEAQKGKPEIIFNTKLFTDQNEEIWLSGFTCGKPVAGALGLCNLIVMIGWDEYVPREEIQRVVVMNKSFRMSFEHSENKKKFFVFNSKNKSRLWLPN